MNDNRARRNEKIVSDLNEAKAADNHTDIVMDQIETSDAEREEKPGCGCLIAILAGMIAMYVLHIALPGRHEGIDHWIARQPTGKEFLAYCTFVVLPLSAFLWGGIYLFGKRFIQVLYWGFMCIIALTIVGYVIVIVGTLLGFK